MNLLNKTFAPINGITNAISGSSGSLGAVVSDRGCPPKGQCSGCTPFCCFDGQEIGIFVRKTNVTEAVFNTATAIITGVILKGVMVISGPIGIAAGVVITLVEYLNSGAIKKSQAKYAKERVLKTTHMMANRIKSYLEVRLPWCECIKNIQSFDYFKANSEVFGADGPAVGADFLKIYTLTALELNNERFGKTKQKIISAEPYQWDINEINLHKGVLMIKVPNIEHYWMGDVISLPGMSYPVTVIHRYGNSKMTTEDCDNVFIDKRIFPDGLYESGRGCSLAYNGNSLDKSNGSSLGGRTHGLNIRQMEGEGLLFCNMPYSETHKSMIGQYVDLANPIYITPDKQVVIPPKSKPNTNQGPGTNNLVITKTSQITPLKSNTALASFASPVAIVVLVGIAAGFIYQTYKND